MTAPTPEREALTEVLSQGICMQPINDAEMAIAQEHPRSGAIGRWWNLRQRTVATILARDAEIAELRQGMDALALQLDAEGRQAAENAELRAEIAQWQERALRDNETLQETYDKLTAKNARLAERCERLDDVVRRVLISPVQFILTPHYEGRALTEMARAALREERDAAISRAEKAEARRLHRGADRAD